MNPIHSDLLAQIKRQTKWCETDLASRLRISQATVNRILQGQADCRGSTFQAIQRLHEEVFAESTAMAEAASVPLSVQESV